MRTTSLKVLGKNVASFFRHHIMSLEYARTVSPSDRLHIERVTDRPGEMIGATYSLDAAARLLRKNKGLCDVFVFLDSDGNKVGTASVMYKGGNDFEYRIRNVDAFIYNVFTAVEHRGRGYAVDMMKHVMAFLHAKGIDKVYLAVSTNNKPAIRAYVKAGFIVERDSSFIRVLRVNIPYRKL